MFRTAQESAPPPELVVVGMTKHFGTFTALEDVSLRLEPGTFMPFLGRTGRARARW